MSYLLVVVVFPLSVVSTRGQSAAAPANAQQPYDSHNAYGDLPGRPAVGVILVHIEEDGGRYKQGQQQDEDAETAERETETEKI